MTKAEYNKRLVEINTRLVEKNKIEDARHNTQIGQNRSEFRAEVNALQAEFTASADDVLR